MAVPKQELTWLEFCGVCAIVGVVGGIVSGLIESSLPAPVVVVIYHTALWMAGSLLATLGLNAWRSR